MAAMAKWLRVRGSLIRGYVARGSAVFSGRKWLRGLNASMA
jgi:hypothetical protein